MPDIDTRGLEQLTTDALERTAFMLVDPAEASDPSALTRHATIEYYGSGEGTVTVSASEGFTVELASSLLGVDPGEIDAENQGADAMRELANILAGSLLTQLGAEDGSFRLGLPSSCDQVNRSGDDVICALESEGEPLVVTWTPRPGQAKAA